MSIAWDRSALSLHWLAGSAWARRGRVTVIMTTSAPNQAGIGPIARAAPGGGPASLIAAAVPRGGSGQSSASAAGPRPLERTSGRRIAPSGWRRPAKRNVVGASNQSLTGPANLEPQTAARFISDIEAVNCVAATAGVETRMKRAKSDTDMNARQASWIPNHR